MQSLPSKASNTGGSKKIPSFQPLTNSLYLERAITFDALYTLPDARAKRTELDQKIRVSPKTVLM